MMGVLDTLPEGDDTGLSHSQMGSVSGTQTPNSSFYSLQQHNYHTSSPIPPNQSTGTLGTGSFKSVSPVSSLDSGSQVIDPQSFESQLAASPMMADMLERVVRCEATNKELRRDLADAQRKVNILVDYVLNMENRGQPEFKDPFSANANASGASTPLYNPRPSMGNIAPNQIAPVDDIGNISQRLNVLTSSVGQLLAIQTQQLQQNSVLDGRSHSVIGLSTPPIELAPNQMHPGAGPVNHGLPPHGIPNRPDLRPPQRGPMRTYSTGTLELPPVRPLEQTLQRDALMGKRNSVVKGLLRRDSSGVSLPDSTRIPMLTRGLR